MTDRTKISELQAKKAVRKAPEKATKASQVPDVAPAAARNAAEIRKSGVSTTTPSWRRRKRCWRTVC